jgi:transposase
MLEQGFDLRGTVEILNIEERIPKNHLLRKIDAAVDFSHIYDLVGSRYSKDKGRKSVDPVVLFKIVLIQHLYGIPSLRQTMRDIDMNMAYRWVLGYNFSEPVPHFATVSYAFAQRYDSRIAEEVFQWILYEAEKADTLSRKGCLWTPRTSKPTPI